jgi:flagellar motor protein MotB
VAAFYHDNFAIDKKLMHTVGYGESRLLDNSGSDAAASANRRIELHIRFK